MQEGVPLISSRIFIAGSQKHCFKRTTKKKNLPLAIHVHSAYLHVKLLRVLERTSVCNQTFTLKLKELENPALNVKEHIKYNSTVVEESDLHC